MGVVGVGCLTRVVPIGKESKNSLGIQGDKCRVDPSGPSLSADERQATNHSLTVETMKNGGLCFPRLSILCPRITADRVSENLNPSL